MSSRRTRGSRITEDEINQIISKLQSLLSEIRQKGIGKVKASKLLKETCDCIKNLNREVDDLSEKLSEIISNGSLDITGPQAELLRSLLSH